MPLIDCGTNLVLTRSASCFTIDAPISSQIPTFATTDTTPYFPVVTLSTQDNVKLLQPSFKRIINQKIISQN